MHAQRKERKQSFEGGRSQSRERSGAVLIHSVWGVTENEGRSSLQVQHAKRHALAGERQDQRKDMQNSQKKKRTRKEKQQANGKTWMGEDRQESTRSACK